MLPLRRQGTFIYRRGAVTCTHDTLMFIKIHTAYTTHYCHTSVIYTFLPRGKVAAETVVSSFSFAPGLLRLSHTEELRNEPRFCPTAQYFWGLSQRCPGEKAGLRDVPVVTDRNKEKS